jgi:membrane peptidoglycan carboxypeptidase
VLVREALQQSLNIPAIRALQRVGSDAVAKVSADLGLRFAGPPDAFLQSGLAGAIGTVEVRPLDLTAAFGAIANNGFYVPPRLVLEVTGPDGEVVYRAPQPTEAGRQAVSPQTAGIVSDILAGNTDPSINAGWGPVLQLRNGPGGSRRPAAAKTGTTDDARDLSTYGFLPPPADAAAPALAVGVWLGNSDHSMPATRDPAISLEGPAPLWNAFVRDASAGKPVSKFTLPGGLVRATIDAWSGGATGPWTRESRSEYFIAGTEPRSGGAVDRPGLLYRQACGGWRVDPVKAELGLRAWRDDVADWLSRARRGVGVTGKLGTATAYLPGEGSWGGGLVGRCAPPPQAPPAPVPGQPPGPGPAPSPAPIVPPPAPSPAP